MANVGTVTFDIAAESAKLRSELDKVKKDVGGISSTAKGLERGLKTVGAALVGAFSVGAVVGFFRQINQAADRVQDLSQRLGVSASRLNVMDIAATQAGASTEAVSTAMAKLTENIGSAAMGSKTAEQAIDTLGLSTAGLLKLRPDQAFEAVTAALSRMPNEFQRASVAQDLFGRGAKELSGFYREGASAIELVDAALQKHGAALSDLDFARIGVMNDDLALQDKIIDNLGAKVLSNLSPAFGFATDRVSDLIVSLGGAEEAGKEFGVTLVRVISAIEIAASLIAATFETVRSAVATVATVALTAVDKIIEANLALARALNWESAINRLEAEHEAISGIAESMKSIAISAAANAQAAMTYMFSAMDRFMNADKIFEAKSKEMDARAKAAAARAGGGGAIASAGGELDPSRIHAVGDLTTGSASANVRVAGPSDFELDRVTQEIYDKNLLALKAAGVLRQQEWEHQLNDMGVTLGNSIAYQTGLEAAKYETWGSLAGQFVGVIAGSNTKMAKLQQGLAIAQAIWWTASGVANALRSVPYPANIAAAAKVAVMGALQIAKIRAAKYSGSGSITGGDFGTGGGAGGAEGQPGFVTPPAVEQPQPQRVAQVIIHGDVFSSTETANWLVGVLREAVNDRDVTIISSNSRQALDLGAGA